MVHFRSGPPGGTQLGYPEEATVEPRVPSHRARTSNTPAILIGAITALVAVVLLSNPKPAYLFMLGGAVGALVLWRTLVVVRRDPSWLIFCLIVVEVLNASHFMPSHTRAPIHYFLIVLLCAPFLYSAWNTWFVREGGFRLYLIYFGWATVTVAYSLAPLTSLARIASSLVLFGAVVALIADVNDEDGMRALLWRALIGCGAMVALNAAAAVILPGSSWEVGTIDSPNPGVPRFLGLLTGPNEIGALMIVSVGIALTYWRYAESRLERATAAGTIVGALAIAALADSRSPFIAIAAGMTAYALWRYRARGILLLSIGAGVLAVVLIVTRSDVGQYVSGRDISTLTGRTDVWQFVVEKIRERPLVGYGYDVAGEIFQSRYFPIWWGPWEEGPHSSLHNGYFDVAIGMGIPAALFWLFILLRPWVWALRSRRAGTDLVRIAFLMVIPFLILNLDESAIGDFRGALSLVMGLVWALAERRRMEAVSATANVQNVMIGDCAALLLHARDGE